MSAESDFLSVARFILTIGRPEAVNIEIPKPVEDVILFVEIDEELSFNIEVVVLIIGLNDAEIDCRRVCFGPSFALLSWRVATEEMKSISTRAITTKINIKYLGNFKNNPHIDLTIPLYGLIKNQIEFFTL